MSKARKGVIPIILFAIFIVTVFASTRSNLRDYNTFYTSDNYFSTTVIDYADGASFVKTDGDVPDHAVSIGDSKGLQEFLLGSGTYGYLVADISIDWEGVGSTITFGSGRVLDGRGHKINLTDKDADALISDEDYGVVNLNWSGVAQDCNYSLFICVNSGVIKNTVFEYDTEICAVNNGNAEINGVGIVCGENKGSIENCELNATGKFSYFYMEGTDDYSESFQNYFGGFAGKNSGRIVNVKGNFNDFDLRLRTIANSDDMFGEVELISKTVAGGIAGCMTDPDGECRNVVVLGNNVVFNLTSDCFGDVSGIKYSGAVVADNTCGGTVDNVIVNFSPEYVESLSDRDFVSKNAAVHCGTVTNVTAIDTYEGGKNIRSVNCDCDLHKYSYCNAIYLDELTNVEYGINDNGEQVFEITSEKGYIESLSFNKYRIVNGGFTTDDSFYGDDLDNFDSHNFDIRWDKGKTFNISPYQSSGEYCWEIKASSWRAAEFEFADGKSITYTGKDVLFDFVKLKLIDEGYIDCDYTKFNLCNGDERIYDAVMVGEYDLTIKPIEKFGREFLYYDEQNRIMTPAPENCAQDVHKCFIAPTEIIFMQDVSDWTSKEFYFALKDAIDGAADGLVYSIDGNDPISENSLILHHIMDSSPDGSEYRVYLTKNGERVTYDYILFAKVDVCPPILESATFTNPIDGKYYAENKAKLVINDFASGIASIKINGLDMEIQNGEYVVDIEETGRYEIVAIDYSGNTLVYSFDAFIDGVSPTLEVEATDGNGTYESGKPTDSKVRFKANAVFGESGGEIQYRIDEGEWEVYSNGLTLDRNAKIEFRAVANSSDGISNLTSETIVYEVKIGNASKTIDVTPDWFEIDRNKEYDGTDKITSIKFDMSSANVIANFSLLRELDFSARYRSCDAGTNIEIVIDVWAKANSNVSINNLTGGIFGAISARKITVTLISAEGTYGSVEREYVYQIDNAFEDIDLQFESNADLYSVPYAQDYRFWLKVSDYGNYAVGNFDDVNSFDKGAKLTIRKAVISELANDVSDFLNLDTESVAKLKIIFRDAIDGSVTHLLDTSYLSISDGAYLPTESINVAGTYRIKLYMPDDLKPMYILDESLYEIQLNIKDAPPQDEEIPPIDDSEETAPPINSDENGKPDEAPDIVDGNDNDDTYFEENKTYSDVLKGVCAAGASAVGVVAIGLSVNKRVRRKKK